MHKSLVPFRQIANKLFIWISEYSPDDIICLNQTIAIALMGCWTCRFGRFNY